MLLNCGVGEDSWESLSCKEIKPVNPKGNQSLIMMVRLNSNTLPTRCEELTHWKRPWFWERLKAGGEGDDREWDGWMASPNGCTGVWASYRSFWWTEKPGMLQSIGLQRVGHGWSTELIWDQRQTKRLERTLHRNASPMVYKIYVAIWKINIFLIFRGKKNRK